VNEMKHCRYREETLEAGNNIEFIEDALLIKIEDYEREMR
jgi:hypothetical protein